MKNGKNKPGQGTARTSDPVGAMQNIALYKAVFRDGVPSKKNENALMSGTLVVYPDRLEFAPSSGKRIASRMKLDGDFAFEDLEDAVTLSCGVPGYNYNALVIRLTNGQAFLFAPISGISARKYFAKEMDALLKKFYNAYEKYKAAGE